MKFKYKYFVTYECDYALKTDKLCVQRYTKTLEPYIDYNVISSQDSIQCLAYKTFTEVMQEFKIAENFNQIKFFTFDKRQMRKIKKRVKKCQSEIKLKGNDNND